MSSDNAPPVPPDPPDPPDPSTTPGASISNLGKAAQAPPEPPDPYRNCCLYVKTVCGPSRYGKYEYDELVELAELEKKLCR